MRVPKPIGYMMAATGLLALGAIGAANIDYVKQKLSYSTYSATQGVSGAAKLAAKEREHDEKAAKPAATPKQTEARGPCNSDYPNLPVKITEERSPYLPEGSKILCSMKGDFDRDGKDELIGVALSKNGEAMIYSFETTSVPGVRQSMGSMRPLAGSDLNGTQDFAFESLRVTDLGVDEYPQLLVNYTDTGRKVFDIFIYVPFDIGKDAISGIGYDRIGAGKGDKFYFTDIDDDKKVDVVIANGGLLNKEPKPVTVLSLQKLQHLELYLDKPSVVVAETQSKLVEAAASGNTAEVNRIKDASNPYVFFFAGLNLLGATATSDKLMADLYGDPAAFLNRLFSSPQSAVAIFAAFATERFVYHVQTRNDGKIDGNPERGYTALIDGQVHGSFRSKEEARQAILNAEKRRFDEANAPTSYHTFKETTTDPKTGVTTETRTTSVGGPPKTPAQWETERAVSKDPVARGLNEAYQKAGAAKGEAEKKAGEVARGAGKALNEAAGNINRALQDAGRRKR